MKVLFLALSLAALAFGANIDYHVVVQTSASQDAGTNGHFLIYATGHSGEEIELGVLDNTSEDVAQAGSVDTYELKDIADVGVIVCVEIKAKSGDGWLIDGLNISSSSSPKYTFVNADHTLISSGWFEGKSSLKMCRPKVQYVVTTKTAPKYAYDHSAPGTDSKVYATVIGKNGVSTTRMRLEASGIFDNPFNAGATDTFTVEDYFDVGAIDCVQFDIGGNDAWILDRAEVQSPSDKLNVYTTERVLLSTDASEAPSYAKLCRAGAAGYEVRVKTSDDKYSGTDRIFIRAEIEGGKGTTTTSLLDNNVNKGHLSEYHYEDLANVGKVNCITLTAYPNGKDAWKPSYVEVVALYNGNVVNMDNVDNVFMSSDPSEGASVLKLCK